MNALTDLSRSRYRAAPDLIRLPAGAGAPFPEKPPVRIFLGTEDGQWRAERVFLYAIDSVRDPGRDYEIYLMKNLSGFDRRRWRTGFTNYRFAIPELAGGAGRAIYNDVDQIYLEDPAMLFDLPLDGHGYLSVSAEDTSVMLLDCERMMACWNLSAARASSKSALLRSARQAPWGELDGRWNARDSEFPREEVRLLHYTALHLQPWCPFPGTYSYHDNPMGDLWFDLERQADACGYQTFTSARPSARFSCRTPPAEAVSPETQSALKEFVLHLGARSLCLIGPQPRGTDQSLDFPCVTEQWHSFANLPARPADTVVAWDLSEYLPAEDVPWALDALFRSACKGVFLTVNVVPVESEDSVDVNRSQRTPRWWQDQLTAVARRYPELSWEFRMREEGRRIRTLRSEPPSGPLSVWLLEGHRLGDVMQLRQLAQALGWPCRSLRMKYNPLHVLPGFILGASKASVADDRELQPPWPDVVIASGKRSSAVARWVKRQSGGATRLVHVGRPWTRLDEFDLIITTPQYRLPARPNILHLSLPIHSRPVAEKARPPRASTVANLPRPRIAVLVGGNSTSCALTTRAAARLGSIVNGIAESRGGSLLISGSPRTPRKAFHALAGTVTVPASSWEFGQSPGDNPYQDFLAAADEIVVTGDSVSMLADAVASGRPVRIYPLPRSVLAWLVTALHAPIAWWLDHRRTYRGTPKQQGRFARLYDRLVELGLVSPPRDLAYLHEVLARRGIVNGHRLRSNQATLADEELRLAVERIRSLANSVVEVGNE